MRLTDPTEVFLLTLLYRWERTAPAERHLGVLDEKPDRNTQIARLIYALNLVAVGREDQEFSALARHALREDGFARIAKHTTWMISPHELRGGWYIDGCASLEQKQWIVQQLTRVGVSPAFVRALDDFVAGESIRRYFPTPREAERLLEHGKAEAAADPSITVNL